MARNTTSNYTTAPQLVTDGVKFTMYRATVRLLDNTVVMGQMVPFGTMLANFTGVPAGDYHARVEVSNADASQVGPGADSAPFNVPSDDATLEVPTAVNVVVHPLV